MSLPHFPSLPKGLKYTDPNAKNCLLVYYDKTQEWKLEHERRLLSFVAFVDENYTPKVSMLKLKTNLTEEYEARKKGLGLNK